jgi:hypothetical protein
MNMMQEISWENNMKILINEKLKKLTENIIIKPTIVKPDKNGKFWICMSRPRPFIYTKEIIELN